MRVVERRFLRGPNIYRQAPCFVALLDLSDHRPCRLGERPGGTAHLQALLPGRCGAVIVDAGELAGLLAQLLMAVQSRAGSPARWCTTVRPSASTPGRYRVVCDYQHEAVATEALRLSMDLVTALLQHQTFALDARLDALSKLVAAHASDPATQALLLAAHKRGIPVLRPDDNRTHFTLGWGIHQRHHHAGQPETKDRALSIDTLFARDNNGRIPLIAVTGTNGKTTTTQLIAHVLRACGARTGTTTTQGIFIDGQCVQTGDCSGYWSARRVLTDPKVEAATLETARGGILKRGLAFDRCDVGVVLNVSSDHLGLDGVETLQDLAHVKGLVARSAHVAAVLNAEDRWCVLMREKLSAPCQAVFFSMDPQNPVFVEHVQAGGAGACLDDEGWLVWCHAMHRSRVVMAAELPFTWQGRARYNIANALAALAALCSMGHEPALIAQALLRFVSDAKDNPLRGNRFEVDGVRLIVDYAHNVVACRALCETARSMLDGGGARLLGVVTSPGDRRPEDLYETGRVCGDGFDELVVYEHDPRGRGAGATTQEILRGARSAAPGKPLHAEPQIRQALQRGLNAARPGDLLVFTCAGGLDDFVEGIRLKSPAAADRIALGLAR